MSDTAASQHQSPQPPSSRPAASVNRATARIHLIVVAVLLCALTAVVEGTVRAGDSVSDPGRLLAGYAVAWALFAASAWAVRKVPVRAAIGLVLAGAAAVALAGLAAPPRTSTDMYRYAWDGRVQAAGISPYAFPPAAPELAKLRDDWLFPAKGSCQGWGLTRTDSGLCVRINRP
ncbi:hypothetical protein ACWDAS_40995, partial [Streptomyces sp. NPDC001070]